MSETNKPESNPDPTLKTLLISNRDPLLRHLKQKASGLLHYESEEDLLQGIYIRALKVRDHFEYQGERAFMGWVRKIAAQHIADRNEYWKAKKRKADKLFRITLSDPSTLSGRKGVNPAAVQTGADTRLQRKEMVDLALEAVATLKERDRKIVQWMAYGLSIDDMAEKLEISYDAAERARLRALDRFRKAFGAITDSTGS
jgi:RNA polymerase sigma factor (sigma-70 family)